VQIALKDWKTNKDLKLIEKITYEFKEEIK